MLSMKVVLLAAMAAVLSACASYGPAPDYDADMVKMIEADGFTCPAEVNLVYGPLETDGIALDNNIVLDSRFRDPDWASGPIGHRIYMHERAHTCGANEIEANSLMCRWWICDRGFTGALR